MKLRDIIENLDKSKTNKILVDTYSMAEIFDIDSFGMEYYESDRFYYCWIFNWMCTDTHVGYKAYFFDDELVAVSSQMARKCEENFEWLSTETFKKLKNYALSFKPDEEPSLSILNLDEEVDYFKVNFNEELFSKYYDRCMYDGEDVKIVKLLKNVTDYWTGQRVVIQFLNGNKKDVSIRDLEFKPNTIS